MDIQVEIAKNDEYTLKINDIYLYSKYDPRKNAQTLIAKEYDSNSRGYIIIGLGLGYHLEAILKLEQSKEIIVLYLFKEELDYFNKFGEVSLKEKSNVKLLFISDFYQYDIDDYQIIIPNPWLKAINVNHPLFGFLEDIKIRQMSINSYREIMEENFHHNIMNFNNSIMDYKDKYNSKIACLVSAGPSLDENLQILQKIQGRCFILCVGSALKVLLEANIIPNAVIIADAQKSVTNQLINTSYHKELFFLCTANKDAVKIFEGNKIIIFQNGYQLAEEYARENNIDLLETGGSVATVAISLLEYMGFSKIILFGQDLGFEDGNTHAKKSTSNKKVSSSIKYRKVLSNSNKLINTTSNLETYARWIERKVESSNNLSLYNTAYNGMKIKGIPYINNHQVYELIVND